MDGGDVRPGTEQRPANPEDVLVEQELRGLVGFARGRRREGGRRRFGRELDVEVGAVARVDECPPVPRTGARGGV